MKKLILILVLVILGANLALPADFSVKSYIDKKSIDAGEVLKLTLEINGFSQASPKITLPKFDGFVVISANTFNEISIVNNEVGSLAKMVYLLKPVKTGKLVIPEIKVKYKNKEYSAPAIEVEIKGTLPIIPQEPKNMPQTDSVAVEEVTL